MSQKKNEIIRIRRTVPEKRTEPAPPAAIGLKEALQKHYEETGERPLTFGEALSKVHGMKEDQNYSWQFEDVDSQESQSGWRDQLKKCALIFFVWVPASATWSIAIANFLDPVPMLNFSQLFVLLFITLSLVITFTLSKHLKWV